MSVILILNKVYSEIKYIFREIKRICGNFIFCPQAYLSNKVNCRGCRLRNVKFHLGYNTSVTIENSILHDCTFSLLDENCFVKIGSSCRIKGLDFYCEDKGSSIAIMDRTTCGGGHMAATEGVSINIGSDCMFAEDVEIRNGDSHDIVDLSVNSIRVNRAESVLIGNHVWVAAHARILKGSSLPDNSILSNSSVLTSKFDKKNSIYGGIPARLLKSDIEWYRSRTL